MANWCLNTVEFSGDEQKIKEIEWLFNVMAVLGKQTRKGQLPPFIVSSDGHFHDISVENGIIKFETKWTQNTDILVQIADYFQTGFLHEYYEPGMWICGEAVYEDKMLSDICIDPESFEQVEYRGKEGYLFEGQSYETDMEIMELLLERKKSGLDHISGYRR